VLELVAYGAFLGITASASTHGSKPLPMMFSQRNIDQVSDQCSPIILQGACTHVYLTAGHFSLAPCGSQALEPKLSR
jgi:hypothetical protein